ncbi:cytochrome o ubiquinol oxidase subunit IV [Solimonas soli]|uniref:cytochrome o ubiquinol oxidase subunit IV n=1 Tax=Solimonas soli TaxID=413479 RepID=UPI000483D7EF
MSTTHHNASGAHGGADEPHVHSHDHGHGGGAPHSTLKGYMTGFVLSVILTAIPFWIVMGDVFKSNHTATVVVLAFAFVQIFVHMVYFLHMNTSSEGGWNMLALIFTGVLVIITLSGSLWVMYHMNANMMPPSVHDMRNMP